MEAGWLSAKSPDSPAKKTRLRLPRWPAAFSSPRRTSVSAASAPPTRARPHLAGGLATRRAAEEFSRYPAVRRVPYRSSFLLHFRCIGGECIPEFGSGALQTGLHRSDFDAGDGCNFRQRELFIMREDEYLSLGLR